MLDKEELQNRMHLYLQKYGESYDKVCVPDIEYLEMNLSTFIETYYEDVYNQPRKGENAFFQIFSAIGALPNEINPYYQMMKEIEKNFGLDRDIIEIGCGMFPALSYEIAKRQQEIGKGTITAFDEQLITKTLDGITLINKNFTLITPISKNALIVGRKPCHGTETMIKAATSNKLEMYLQLCYCYEHRPNNYTQYPNITHEERVEKYFEEIISNTLSPEFEVEKSTTPDLLVGSQNTNIKIKRKQNRVK